jgi:hypothetical protein
MFIKRFSLFAMPRSLVFQLPQVTTSKIRSLIESNVSITFYCLECITEEVHVDCSQFFDRVNFKRSENVKGTV